VATTRILNETNIGQCSGNFDRTMTASHLYSPVILLRVLLHRLEVWPYPTLHAGLQFGLARVSDSTWPLPKISPTSSSTHMHWISPYWDFILQIEIAWRLPIATAR